MVLCAMSFFWCISFDCFQIRNYYIYPNQKQNRMYFAVAYMIKGTLSCTISNEKETDVEIADHRLIFFFLAIKPHEDTQCTYTGEDLAWFAQKHETTHVVRKEPTSIKYDLLIGFWIPPSFSYTSAVRKYSLSILISFHFLRNLISYTMNKILNYSFSFKFVFLTL